MIEPDQFISTEDGHRLAYRRQRGTAPAVVFLPGFRSDMGGTKAEFLAAHCARLGRSYLRFDYRGHGLSSGAFADGAISDWLADTLLLLDRQAGQRYVLVGSSMGGWIALLAALARPNRLAGLVGIAAAPDFTSRLILPQLTAEAAQALQQHGQFLAPSDYGEPVPITRRLLEDGRRHLLLDGPIAIHAPVHLLHGQADAEVPWRTALDVAARLQSREVTVELVKDGDHRLSRDADLKRLAQALDRMLDRVGQHAA